MQLGLRMLGHKDLQHAASHNVVTLFLVDAFGGRAVLGENTSLTSCVIGLTMVLSLNEGVSFATSYSQRLTTFFESPVRQLVKNGVLQARNMRRSRCSKDVLAAQLRSKGESDLAKVRHAFIKRTGEITFILQLGAAAAGAQSQPT